MNIIDARKRAVMNPRRAFLRQLLCGAGVAGGAVCLAPSAAAIEPFARKGDPRMMLSLAAYSFRDSLPGAKPAANPARQIDLFQFIDYCAEHGCDGTELTSYYFPKDVTPEFLLQIKRHAFLRGITISGTAVGNTFTHPPGAARDKELAHVRQWIDHAQLMGAPHIRIFAGNAPGGVSLAEAKRHCIETIEACCAYAGQRGVFLGLENHGGIVAEPEDLLDIVRAVKSPWFGINLDSGNFHTADPYADLARCVPFAVNVQVKVEMTPRGQAVQRVDLARLMKLLREANYQGFVALEYEAKEDPWVAVPRWLGQMKHALAQA
jgi:sugar phosphate isomerase/epimerase